MKSGVPLFAAALLAGKPGTWLQVQQDERLTGTFSATHDSPTKWIYDQIGGANSFGDSGRNRFLTVAARKRLRCY